MKKKLLAVVLSGVLAAGMLVGCGSETPATAEAPAAEAPAEDAQEAESAEETAEAEPAGDEIVIGCTLQNLSEEFMVMLQGAMELQLKNYDNVKLIINDAESQSDKQASQLDSFVAQKVDAVIISPVDADALASAVKTVTDAGIPVITCSADVSGDQGQVWVGSSNENGGEIEMRYVAEQLGGKGKIAVLRGPLGAFAEQGRFAGYETVLEEYPDIEIVFDQTGNWQREEAIGQGTNALDMAVKAANGESIERMDIPFELVTKENVEEYYDRIKLPE